LVPTQRHFSPNAGLRKSSTGSRKGWIFYEPIRKDERERNMGKTLQEVQQGYQKSKEALTTFTTLINFLSIKLGQDV